MKGIYKSVLVIDDHKMIANGIKHIIGDLFDQVYMAHDGASGKNLALKHFPELIIVDYSLPDTTGELLVRELKFKLPSVKILTYSFSYSPEVIVQMLRAGTNGYVIKKDNDEEFIKAIHAIMAGKDFFCKEARNHVINRFSADEEEQEESELIQHLAANTNFSPKMIVLIRMLCKQMSTREIGHHLQLSERTVEQYRSNIIQKIGAKNLAGIVKYALQIGIVQLEDL
jgi:DNA-binding NarL/FixJ family response regulator